MKSFQEFISEAVSDAEYAEQRAKSRLDQKGRAARRKGSSTSFARAMKALNNGDMERHKFWLAKAYHALTGKQEVEE